MLCHFGEIDEDNYSYVIIFLQFVMVCEHKYSLYLLIYFQFKSNFIRRTGFEWWNVKRWYFFFKEWTMDDFMYSLFSFLFIRRFDENTNNPHAWNKKIPVICRKYKFKMQITQEPLSKNYFDFWTPFIADYYFSILFRSRRGAI